MAGLIQPFIPGLWRKWLTVTGTSQNIALPAMKSDECLLITNMGTTDVAIEFVSTGAGVAVASGDTAGIVVMARACSPLSRPETSPGFLAIIGLAAGPVTVQIIQGRSV
jgi:hypothetical protein